MGSPARLISHPSNMTRIDVLKPNDFHWRPGQHVFLHFPNVSLFDNHPFTITSADEVTMQSTAADDPWVMSFFVRTYGGVDRELEVSFDNVILVVGVSGVTAYLPWLEHLSNLIQSSFPNKASHVKLV